MESIKRLLHKNITSIIVLIICIICKIIQQVYFFVPTLDRACQLVLAKNLLSGHGLTVNKILSDGVTQVYIPVSSWPPGYPLIVSFLSLLLHISVTNAAIVFDCLSIALVLYFSRKILITLSCQTRWVTIYIFTLGFFLYTFSELPATDLNALGFYLCGLWVTLLVIKRNTIKWYQLLLLIIVNFLPLSLKYLYAPIILIPPIYLCCVGYKLNNSFIRRTGLKFFIGTLILIIALFVFQKLYTGSSIYISKSQTGFFPENLSRYYYVIISSFTNIVFDYTILQRYGLSSFGENYFIIWWLNVLLSLILIGFFFYILIRKSLSVYSLKFHYIVIGSLTSIITILELMFLSVRFQLHSANQPWTYIEEARYMAYIVIFLQQLYFIYIYDNWNLIKSKLLKTTGFIIAFFLVIEICHGIYFTIKISSSQQGYFGFESDEVRIMKNVKNKIYELNKANPSKKVYFTSTDDLYTYAADLEGAHCVFNDDLPADFKTFSNSILLIVKEKDIELKGIKSKCEITNTIGKFEIIQCQ